MGQRCTWRAEHAAGPAEDSRQTIRPSWEETAIPARVSRLSLTALLSIEGSAAICESEPVSIVVMPSLLTTCADEGFCYSVN